MLNSSVYLQNLKGNISKKCFKGLVGLQLNVTKAISSRKNDKKKTSEVTILLEGNTSVQK